MPKPPRAASFRSALIYSTAGFLALAVILGVRLTVVAAGISLATTVTAIARMRPRSWRGPVLGQLTGFACVGLVLIAVYLGSATYTRHTCEAARRAGTVAERRAVLAELDERAWLKWLVGRMTGKGRFVFDCDRAEGELDELERDGLCPYYLPQGVECRCGEARSVSAADCAESQTAICGHGIDGRTFECRDPAEQR